MALRISSESLEERLDSAPLVERDSLVNAIRDENIEVRRPPYLKKELVNNLINYFKKKGVEFGKSGSGRTTDDYQSGYNTLYNINKEPLKPVEHGTKLIGIPGSFLNRLSDWEKLYFLAGIDWYLNEQHSPTNERPALKKLQDEFHEPLDYMSLFEIASAYIRDGIVVMDTRHNRIVEELDRPAQVYKGDRRDLYKKFWKPQRSKIIRSKLAKLQTVKKNIKERIVLQKEFGRMQDDLKNIVSHGDEYYLARGDIESYLDDLETDQLKFLTSYFGSESLGDHAIA